MADVAALHAAVIDHLREAVPTVTVYDGEVPETPPSDPDGRVYPYAVAWSTGPRRHPDRPLQRSHGDGLIWASRVTVAAGVQGWCLAATQAIRDALDGWSPPGAGPLREPDGDPTSVLVRVDRDVHPIRFYVPLEHTTPTTS